MSRTIDERVVEMRFDNQQFERGVQSSLSSLDKLKRGLDMDSASKSMTGLGTAVETVHARFSALQVIGITALTNITNSAINTGKRMISALTIDPIKTGFDEYELKMNSIQTIMSNTASKGTTMADVTKVIGELNTYADKTIYNFAEMTRNIGTFTAAGVGLEESAKAIQGIANLAAASGSNSQQASTAMYQLSQALAAGTVKLMDWNSVVNAGMGGEKFQLALQETAKEYGVNVDALIKKNGSFRDSLQEGWLSADILNTTLSKFTVEGAAAYAKSMVESGKYTQEQADALMKEAQAMEDAATKVKTFTQLWDTLKEAAQSGWGQTWEIIIGDFEEAKALFSDVSDVLGEMIGKSADARNGVLQEWKDIGGRQALIDSLRNAFEALMSVAKPIGEAFREIFPPVTAQQLLKFTEGLRDLTARMKLSDESSANLKATFKGLFSVASIVVDVIKTLASGVVRLLGSFTGISGGVLGITGALGNFVSRLGDGIKEADLFGRGVDGLVSILQNGINKLKEFGSAVKEKFNSAGFEGFLGVLQAIWEVIKNIASKIGEVTSGIGDALANMFRSGDISAALDIVNGGIFAALLLTIKNFVTNLDESIGGIGGSFFDKLKGLVTGSIGSIKDVLDTARTSLEEWQSSLRANTILKIASAVGILAASIYVISGIDPQKLAASLGAVTVLFADLMVALALFNIIGGSYTNTIKATTLMVAMSTSVLILAGALRAISGLDVEQLKIGLTGIASLSAIVVATAYAMSLNSGRIMTGATSLVIFASAITILSSAVKSLSELDWDQLKRGLTGVGILMAEVVAFLHLAKFSGKAITTATGMVILASAIKVLGSACGDFGQMDWSQIRKGLTSIGILLLELAAFTRLTGNASHIMSTSVALIAIGGAMKIFASAVKDMSSMSLDELVRGLTGLGVSLAAVTAAVRLMPKNMVSIGAGLTVVSGALVILAEALGRMGGLSWDEVVKGLVALGGSMTILAVGLKAMTTTLPGSAALLVASSALAVLAPVLSKLGDMSPGEIVKGLVTIAGAFGVIGLAGALLTPLVPTLLGLSGAMALLGVSCLTIGAGLSLTAAGLTALAVAGTTGAAAIVAALTVIVTGIAGLIPVVVQRIGQAIILFCEVIAEGAPAIGRAIKAVVLSLVSVLVECVPALVDGALRLISALLDSLATYTPQIVDSILSFVIQLIQGVAKRMPELLTSVADLMMSFFSGVIDALKMIDPEVLVKGLLGVGLLSALLVALGTVASLVPMAMVGVLGMGVVIAELALVLAAIGALAQIPGLEWLINEGGDFLQAVGTAIGQFVGGIIGGVAEGVTSVLPQIGKDLAGFMTNAQPFIDGAKLIDASMLEGVKMLAETVLILTGAGLLEAVTSWLTGGSSLADFGSQLVPFGQSMMAFSNAVSGVNIQAIAAAASAGKILAEMMDTIPNSGGVVAWFTGDSSIAAFGDELVKFGSSLKAFSVSVTGINIQAISMAASGGKILAEMANTVPNTGGLKAWFVGDNSVASFGKELISFGKSLSEFSVAVAGVNIQAIEDSASATKALTKMANAIPESGGFFSKFTADNDLSTFGSELTKFGGYLKRYSDNVAGINIQAISTSTEQFKKLANMAKGLTGVNFDGMSSFGKSLTNLGRTGIDGFIRSFTNAEGKVKTAGSNMVTTFIQGIESKQSSLNNIFSKIVQTPLKNITDKQKEFETAGQGVMTRFITGVKSKDTTVSKTFSTIIAQALTTIRDKHADFRTAGGYLVQGFADGISANTYKAVAEARAMAAAAARAAERELDIQSPSKVGFAIGGFFALGFVNGIESYVGRASTISSEMARAAGTGLMNPIAEMVEMAASNLSYGAGAFKEFIKTYESAMDQTFYGARKVQYASQAISAYGKQLYEESEQYKTDTKAVEEHTLALDELEAKRLEINEEMSKLQKSNSKDSKARISELKKELETNDKNIKMAKDQLIQDQEDIKTHTAETFNKMRENLSNSIESFVNPLKVSLDTQIDIFKKFGSDTEVSVFEVLDNMKSQVDGVRKWQSDLEALANKGVATGLLEQLRNMGPTGANYVAAFISMTNEQLRQANATFAQSSAMTAQTLLDGFQSSLDKARQWANDMAELARRGLGQDVLEGLGDMGVSGYEYVNAFLTMTPAQLNEFNAKYESYLALPDNVADKVISSFAFAGSDASKTFIDSMDTEGTTKVLTEDIMGLAKKSFATIKKLVVDSSTKLGTDTATGISTGIKNETPVVVKGATVFAGSVRKAAGDELSIDKTFTIGTNMCTGVANGIQNGQSTVISAAVSMASAAYSAACASLGIESPSKKFMEAGMYIDQGFAIGIRKYSGLVQTESSNLGTTTLDTLKDTVSKIVDVINGDIDPQPTIRPVLDLTEVRAGTKQLNTMFSRSQALSVSSSMSKAANSGIIQNGEKSTETAGSINFVQNNYSPKALSRIEIYRQTNNQISTMKGLVRK